MKKHLSKGILLSILTVALLFGMMPYQLTGMIAHADSNDKTISGLGTGGIANPIRENGGWSQVYFGSKDSPILFNVLKNGETNFGGHTLLLDCATTLRCRNFDDDGETNAGAQQPNEWAYSDIRTWLNETFRNNTFTSAEISAIASSNKPRKGDSDGNGLWHNDNPSDQWGLNFAPLTGEQIFLLDAKEATNTSYGFFDSHLDCRPYRQKGGANSSWWLRSPCSHPDDSGSVGYVAYDGGISYCPVYTPEGYTPEGVSPALNVNLSSVLFSSEISSKTYKLTIADTANRTVGIQAGKAITMDSAAQVTVPYTKDSGFNHVSLLITNAKNESNQDITWTGSSGWSSGAAKQYYTTAAVPAGETEGTVTFTLPENYDPNWKVWILAEQVNEGKKTDYASQPVAITVPWPHYSVTVTPGTDMTKTTGSGAESQTDLYGQMTPVVYTANAGYYFPADYGAAPVNGISVIRNSYAQITVSGRPTADTTITLAGASHIPELSLSGSGSEDDPYEVSSVADWHALSEFLDIGGNTSGKYFKQTADISVSEMAGSETGKPFSGTYDGGGKTLTVNISATSGAAAPFRSIYGATITDLKVAGSVSGGTHSAGLAAYAQGTNLIEDCAVGTAVTLASGTADKYCGGCIGHGLESATTLRGVLFSGSLNGAEHAGTFWGWSSGSAVCVLKDCFDVSGSTFPLGLSIGALAEGSGVRNTYYTCANKAAGSVSPWVNGGRFAYSVSAGEGVAIGSGEGAAYGTDGITAYGTGLSYGGTFYAGAGENVTVTAGPAPLGKVFDMWTSEDGVTFADVNAAATTFTMPEKVVTVAAVYKDMDSVDPAAVTGLVYNGKARALITAGEVAGGTFYYALGDANGATEPYTTSIPSKTDAGTYYVWYKVKADANNNDSDPQVVIVKISETNIVGAKAALSKTTFTYNAKVQKPVIKTIKGLTLKEGTDYTAKWSNASSRNAGTYTVTITGKCNYTGTTKATYTINKAVNPMKLKVKTATVKHSKLKKKAQTVKRVKAITVSKAQGKPAYKYVSAKKGNKSFKKYFKVNAKTGNVTVKKGLKKGTYKAKVKVKAAGNANYKASAWKTVTFKVLVK